MASGGNQGGGRPGSRAGEPHRDSERGEESTIVDDGQLAKIDDDSDDGNTTVEESSAGGSIPTIPEMLARHAASSAAVTISDDAAISTELTPVYHPTSAISLPPKSPAAPASSSAEFLRTVEPPTQPGDPNFDSSLDGPSDSTVEESRIENPAHSLDLFSRNGSGASLVVTAGSDRGREFILDATRRMTVGRGLDNDIVLTDLTVSRKHFDLSFDATDGSPRWVLSDRGSGNGSLINDRVEDEPFVLNHNDRIEIGQTEFRFDHPSAPARFPTPRPAELSAAGEHDTANDRGYRLVTADGLLAKANKPKPRSPSGFLDADDNAAPDARAFDGRDVRDVRDVRDARDARDGKGPATTHRGMGAQEPLAIDPPHASFTSPAIPSTVDAANTVPFPRGKPPTQPPPSPRSKPQTNVPPVVAVTAGLSRSPTPAIGTRVPAAAVPRSPTAPPPLAAIDPASSNFDVMTTNRVASKQLTSKDAATRDARLRSPTDIRKLAAQRPTDVMNTSNKTWLILAGGALVLAAASIAVAAISHHRNAVADQRTIANVSVPASQWSHPYIAAPNIPAPTVTAIIEDARPAPPPSDSSVAATAIIVVDAAVATPDAAVPKAIPVYKPPAITVVRTQAKPPPVALAVDKPKKNAGFDVDALLAKADARYQHGDLRGASILLRSSLGDAGKDVATLRSHANDYDVIAAGLAASGGSPTDSLSWCKRALAADKREGGINTEVLSDRIATFAPKAATAALAKQNFDLAYAATVDAFGVGAGDNSTVRGVRASLERKAGEWYGDGMQAYTSDPTAARNDFSRVLSIVPNTSSWYLKATAALKKLEPTK